MTIQVGPLEGVRVTIRAKTSRGSLDCPWQMVDSFPFPSMAVFVIFTTQSFWAGIVVCTYRRHCTSSETRQEGKAVVDEKPGLAPMSSPIIGRRPTSPLGPSQVSQQRLPAGAPRHNSWQLGGLAVGAVRTDVFSLVRGDRSEII